MPATEPAPTGLRASDLLGRPVTGADGRDLGRVADLVVDGDRIVAVVAVRRPWGRLLGYEREQAGGPWLVEALARWILRRDSTEIPWSEAAPGLLRGFE
ncbi:PRC-barrel domain-containing protein [Dactylosporangium sp. NPDC051541]|uniref:PRC-barrel domain-containing protein n=1 Tax=Dactylosporangium sp. NPDC051541 TaxID=3363977 RepID=UPI0037AAA102